jgi:hypothetical protein
MLADQGGRCLICSVALGDAKAHVDHDHVTGVVRGILCFNCNGGLGQFKEDAHLLRDAADYIDASSVIAPHGVSAGAARLISMGLLPVSAISETRRAEV